MPNISQGNESPSNTKMLSKVNQAIASEVPSVGEDEDKTTGQGINWLWSDWCDCVGLSRIY